jgi:hypothetical protein
MSYGFDWTLPARITGASVTVRSSVSCGCCNTVKRRGRSNCPPLIFGWSVYLLKQVQYKSEDFWRWCVIICKTVLLGFVHRLNYKIIKLQRFGSWILLPSSGKKWGKRTESLSVGLPGWASLRLGPCLQLPGRCLFITLLFYDLDDWQSPKEQSKIIKEAQ